VLNASNGQVLITSETYTTKESCKVGIASSKVSVFNSNFRQLTSSNWQYYFTQNANNNQVLGTSEMYVSSQGRDNGIDAVKRDAPIANIEDLTL
jgi:uncharacterized protein YegP (UPF0339 family)